MLSFNAKFSTLLIASILVVLAVSVVPASAQLGVWRDINPTSYISPPANPQLNSVYMLSPTEGWSVGDSRPTTNTTTGLPAIFHYDGQTWNFVPAPQFMGFPSTPVAYNLTAVTFGPPNNPINRNDGWAVGFTNFTIVDPRPQPPQINSCNHGPPGPPNGVPECAALALHWDGVGWRLQTAGLIGPNAGPLWDAFMDSSTDVWAVGQNTAGTMGIFWHWTGVAGLGGGWNMPQGPIGPNPTTGTQTIFYSVFMVSTTEGWAVGSGGAIWHYSGGAWSAFSSPVSGLKTCGTEVGVSLRSVYMVSPSQGWAVGDCGTIVQYQSGTWNGPVSPGTTTNNLYKVVMVSSDQGWAFGQHGTILHYSGGSWTHVPQNLVPTTPVGVLNFNGAYFNTPTDGWSVGTDGVILHYDGVNYGTVTSPTISNFTSISFGPPQTGPINPNDGWAVGNASAPSLVASPEPTVYHWNGFVWTKGVSVGTTNNLNSVFMVNGGDVWTVGGGENPTASCSSAECPVILHFTGGSWNTITPPPGAYVLKSIYMVSSTEGWAVGEQQSGPKDSGIILHYTVSGGVGTWAVFPAPASPSPVPPLNAVFMLSPTEGWVTGDNATILHYTVSGGVGTWNPVAISGSPTLSNDANLTSIFMLSPTMGWIVGGIQADSSFSAGPVSLFWDGTKWEPVPLPPLPGGMSPTGLTSATLKTVFFTNPNDGWAAGLPGKLAASIFHWDGISWRVVVLSPPLIGQIPGQIPPILSSIFMTSEAAGWIVGSDPGITGSPYFTWPPFPVVPSCAVSLPPCSTPPAILAAPAPFTGKALSAILEFATFGGTILSTSTSVVIQTVTTSTTAVTATTASTFTSGVTVPPATITIIVHAVNAQGNPLQGVTVSIPSLGLQGVTDVNGNVSFTLPPGTYTVTLSQGSTTITQTISATTSGQTITLTFAGGPGIPGFPVESIIGGISVGVLTMILLRRRHSRRQ